MSEKLSFLCVFVVRLPFFKSLGNKEQGAERLQVEEPEVKLDLLCFRPWTTLNPTFSRPWTPELRTQEHSETKEGPSPPYLLLLPTTSDQNPQNCLANLPLLLKFPILTRTSSPALVSHSGDPLRGLEGRRTWSGRTLRQSRVRHLQNALAPPSKSVWSPHLNRWK